jgi:hypothetical protein
MHVHIHREDTGPDEDPCHRRATFGALSRFGPRVAVVRLSIAPSGRRDAADEWRCAIEVEFGKNLTSSATCIAPSESTAVSGALRAVEREIGIALGPAGPHSTRGEAKRARREPAARAVRAPTGLVKGAR